MSSFSLLAPLGLIGLITVPIIVLLYMRTTTPTERSIPSTRFWVGAETAPTDKQRFRMPPLSVLLLVHLLIAGLITFALAQPASASLFNRFAGRADPRHLILIVDGSTSMGSAVDPLGSVGRTHYDLAKASARERLADLTEGDSATVLLIGTHTSTYQASDPAELNNLLDVLDSRPLPGGQADFNAALRLCRDLVVPGVQDEIVLISDGAGTVDPALVAELTAPITFEQITGSVSTNNVAITELSATGSATYPGRQDLFARIVNFGDRRVVVNLTITADGIGVIERALTIDPGAAATVTQLLPAGAVLGSATIAEADALIADNTAAVSLADSGLSGIRMLLVSDAPSSILRALSAIPGSQVETLTRNQFLASGASDGTDLIVFEGAIPSTSLPTVPILFVNPGGSADQQSSAIADPAPVRVRTQDPIMTGVDLAGVTFGQIPVLTLKSDDIEVVGAEGGPLIYRTRTSADQEAIVLAFDIGLSNLPVRVAFPILVANVVDDLVDRGLPASLAAGNPLTLTVGSDVAAVSITLPDGTIRSVPTSNAANAPTSVVTFGETGQPGSYLVQLQDSAGVSSSEFTVIVNAGHPIESNLVPNPLIATALQTPTSTQESGSSRLRFDLWPLVLMAVLGLLAFEWIGTLLTHHRRSLLTSQGASK